MSGAIEPLMTPKKDSVSGIPSNSTQEGVTSDPIQIEESDVQMLMQMGFRRDQVIHALQERMGNVEHAAAYLLDQPPS